MLGASSLVRTVFLLHPGNVGRERSAERAETIGGIEEKGTKLCKGVSMVAAPGATSLTAMTTLGQESALVGALGGPGVKFKLGEGEEKEEKGEDGVFMEGVVGLGDSAFRARRSLVRPVGQYSKLSSVASGCSERFTLSTVIFPSPTCQPRKGSIRTFLMMS